MTINIIDTIDISNSPWADEVTLIRLVDIDGVRHLQMQGRIHEIMPATWSSGLIMTCPESLTLEQVAADPSRYYRGYGDGCELCIGVPDVLQS